MKLQEWRLVAEPLATLLLKCWGPARAEPKPLAWPPAGSNPWARTKPAFFNDRLAGRPLAGKEKPQLPHLLEGWGALVISQAWEWSGWAPLPLRLLVESLLCLLTCACKRDTQSWALSAELRRPRSKLIGQELGGPFLVSSEGALNPCASHFGESAVL